MGAQTAAARGEVAEWRQGSAYFITNGSHYVSKTFHHGVAVYHAWRGKTTRYEMAVHLGCYLDAAHAKARCTGDASGS